MHIGHYISGAGHVGLIAWVLLGGMFSEAENPVEVTQVSVISAEEFAALSAAVEPPEMLSDVPQPMVPDTDDAPEMNSAADSAPDQPEPVAAEPAAPDPEPDVVPQPPVAEVEDTPPVIQPPAEEMVALSPEPDPEPAPREAPRVAPEPVAPPEPDVTIDDQTSRETTPDEPAEEVVEPEEETAPEAATTEIVTEAEEAGSAAPVSSLRPRARPVRQAAAEPEPEPETETESEADPASPTDGVNAALAEALAEAQAEPPRPASGPPLTRGEQDALRIAVQDCWVVDVGSRAANVTVTLAMSLDRSGKILSGSLKMISGEGGDQRAIQTAFQSARRAVLRCQKGGYNLPPEKYDHWREIEMTFNPERMRIK